MLNKRTRILIICANPQDGTSFYRGWGPFSKLDNVELVFSKDLSWPVLSTVDILFFQRPSAQVNVQMIADAKRFHVPVWSDWDDDGFHLEETNPAYDYFSNDEKQAALRELLRISDVCSVSTHHLKEVFLREVPTANIVVVPNAVDDSLFSLKPSYHKRNKIISLRGGSSHEADWGQYKDTILRVAKRCPNWTWAIMGYHPEWFNEIENIQIYEFADIPMYFEKLMELRPSIAIVPLVDSLFNRSKSNIAFQEFTLAGAAVLASDLPEFKVPGCATFKDGIELTLELEKHIEVPEFCIEDYETALKHLPILGFVNEQRKDIIEKLLTGKKKFHPIKKDIQIFTDKQFHDYELAYGMTPDLEAYQELNEKTAKWIVDTMNPKSALELGCGVGGTMIELLKKGVNVVGFEMNPHSVQYFKEHYPVYQNQIILTDITKEPIDNDSVGDLVYSIECFEHITMPEEWWSNYLTELSKKFRYFYFTSTPFHSIESFDRIWGHCNIRIMSRWKKLFEDNGWECISNPRIAVLWDLHFKSKNVWK